VGVDIIWYFKNREIVNICTSYTWNLQHILNSQFSILNSQFSILNSQFSMRYTHRGQDARTINT